MTEQESLDVALALDDAGVDLLEISGDNYESPAMFGDNTNSTDGQLAWHGAYFRNTAAGGTKPVSVTYRGALTRAIARTAFLAATQ